MRNNHRRENSKFRLQKMHIHVLLRIYGLRNLHLATEEHQRASDTPLS
jgi:hypothetical protein